MEFVKYWDILFQSSCVCEVTACCAVLEVLDRFEKIVETLVILFSAIAGSPLCCTIGCWGACCWFVALARFQFLNRCKRSPVPTSILGQLLKFELFF